MALASYLTRTRQLLQNPPASIALYSDSDLTIYINEARVQVAGESAGIRVLGTLSATSGNQGPYGWTSVSLSGSGIQGVLSVRQAWYVSSPGQIWMAPRPWDWFSIYALNAASPASGPPSEWAQFGQGENGSLYINPSPNANYTLKLDAVCYPVPLVDDSTAEAVPALWTTAIPYYAAYLALLSSQTGARTQEAQGMLSLYELFVSRARRFTTPDVQPLIYPQAADNVKATQYEGGQGAPGGG